MSWVDWVLFAVITLLAIAGGIVDNIIIASKMRGHADSMALHPAGDAGRPAGQHLLHAA